MRYTVYIYALSDDTEHCLFFGGDLSKLGEKVGKNCAQVLFPYQVLAELSPGFADTGPPRGVSTGGKQIAPRYTNIHLYFVFALSCRNKYKYKWKHQNS